MCLEQKKTDRLLDPEDCLIVVIDVQEKLVPIMAEKETLIQNVGRLLKFAKILNLPVILTEQENLGPTVREIKELYEGEVISKIHFSCFFSPEFDSGVERSGKKTIVLAGIESHICVFQTALSALDRYAVHVLVDAVSSKSLLNKEVAVERMREAGCIISTTEMFIFEILKRAGTDTFRKVLPIIRY
jgi:nicotinamidase-related amidase